MSDPILAAQLYTLREYTKTAADLSNALRRVKAMGYTTVQISAIGPIPDDEVKQILAENDLQVCITHTAYDRLWKDIDSVIAQHHLWNCKNVAIGSMPQPYRDAGEEGFLRFAAEANAVGKTLTQAGLTFSYHNHSFEFVRFGRRTGLDLLYDETDPRYLMAEMDTYWIQHGGGDPCAWIRRLAGRMPVVHYKDMVMLNGAQTMAEIGEGNLNWPAILQATKDAGIETIAVEQDVCQRDPFESLQISYTYLKTLGLR